MAAWICWPASRAATMPLVAADTFARHGPPTNRKARNDFAGHLHHCGWERAIVLRSACVVSCQQAGRDSPAPKSMALVRGIDGSWRLRWPVRTRIHPRPALAAYRERSPWPPRAWPVAHWCAGWRRRAACPSPSRCVLSFDFDLYGRRGSDVRTSSRRVVLGSRDSRLRVGTMLPRQGWPDRFARVNGKYGDKNHGDENEAEFFRHPTDHCAHHRLCVDKLAVHQSHVRGSVGAYSNASQ